MNSADLAIVIPTTGRWPVLAETLSCLGEQAGAAEIVVVVDGRDTPVPPLGPVRVEVVEHRGPGAARNRGVEITERPLVLFLGDDMVPERGLVDGHIAAHRREAGEKVVVEGGVSWHPATSGPLHGFIDRFGLQFDLAAVPAGADAGWGRFYSCNVSLKRSLFERAGGFDPEFGYYYEDLDLAWRLHREGMVLRYEPAARALHRHGYDVVRLRERFAGVAAGEWMMRTKHTWFEPWFHRRFTPVVTEPPASPAWARYWQLAALVPEPVRRRLQPAADRWCLQQVASAFMDAWDAEVDREELRGYLGGDFDDRRLAGHLCELEREAAAAPDEQTFYRTSTAYLYDLTVFASWPTKVPYREALRRAVAPGSSVLDFGCGIGSEGLRLAERGYRVAFADFDNPSSRFLRWRLDRRGLDLPVYDVDSGVPGGFDAAFAFDVLEHVEDPFATLRYLEARAGTVAVNILEPDPSEHGPHRPLPVDALLAHARRHRVLHHRRYHGRSHLVVYRVRSDRSSAAS